MSEEQVTQELENLILHVRGEIGEYDSAEVDLIRIVLESGKFPTETLRECAEYKVELLAARNREVERFQVKPSIKNLWKKTKQPDRSFEDEMREEFEQLLKLQAEQMLLDGYSVQQRDERIEELRQAFDKELSIPAEPCPELDEIEQATGEITAGLDTIADNVAELSSNMEEMNDSLIILSQEEYALKEHIAKEVIRIGGEYPDYNQKLILEELIANSPQFAEYKKNIMQEKIEEMKFRNEDEQEFIRDHGYSRN